MHPQNQNPQIQPSNQNTPQIKTLKSKYPSISRNQVERVMVRNTTAVQDRQRQKLAWIATTFAGLAKKESESNAIIERARKMITKEVHMARRIYSQKSPLHITPQSDKISSAEQRRRRASTAGPATSTGWWPKSYNLRLTPFTLRSTLYSLNPTPYSLRPTLYTLRSTLYTLYTTQYTVHTCLQPYTLNTYPRLGHRTPQQTLNPKP